MLPSPDTVGAVTVIDTGDDIDPVYVGTTDDMSTEMLTMLQDNGYSLLIDDVTVRVKRAMRFWVSWGIFNDQRNIVAGQTKLLNQIQLTAFEWTQMWDLAKAYCDQLQAIRMDAVRGLGTEPWGMSPPEAEQNVQLLEEKIPKVAFIEGAFSLTLAGDIPQAVVDYVARKVMQAESDDTYIGTW
jgi:hypothetical protein